MPVAVNTPRHNPAMKHRRPAAGMPQDMTYGFLGRPVGQSADTAFCKAALSRVGENQPLHTELVHKLARCFNGLYGEVLPILKARLSTCVITAYH